LIKLYSPAKIKRLNNGSIIPDLKYKCGSILPKYAKAQKIPNRLLNKALPILNKIIRVRIPTSALGSRAANSLMPNIFMETTCIQKKRGGFSKKGS